MGCMLRSDPMTQCEVFLQHETAFGIISRLGEEGCVQFADLNLELNAFQRAYVLDLCRCTEMERKLRYIRDRMQEDEIVVPKLLDEVPALELHEMPGYEAVIDKWERLIVEMTENLSQMSKNHLEMSQMSCVLTDIGEILGSTDLSRPSALGAIKKSSKGRKSDPVAAVQETGAGLTVITGLVHRKRCYNFQVMVWRLSRGNAYYKQADQDYIFKDPAMNNANVRKVAFLLIVQGDALGVRMKKVCDGFRCDLYPMPPTEVERLNALDEVTNKVMDLDEVLEETKFQRCKEMRGMTRTYPTYLMRIKKAKAVYHTMNKFTLDITKNCLIGQCWIPTADTERVQNIFEDFSEKMDSTVPSFLSKLDSFETPPTFHRTNRFTHGFQALINAYGDSTYRELNPGLYTIITFPFLFSMMFADIGHGAIMFITALWMVLNEKKILAQKSDSEIWNIFFGGRYILLLMGIFSIFAGIMYNECFCKAFTIFHSGWKIQKPLSELTTKSVFLLEPSDHTAAYLIGRDPAWELADNKILFENSLKMKLSIIIGIIHMLFGLSLSFVNDIYFKNRYLIILEFLPQVLFLVCIFMWLVILIFIKWFKYGGATPPSIKESQVCAPLVLILFIDMVLMTPSKPVDTECDAYMFGHQQSIQKTLLFVALGSIPIMLFGPPCFATYLNKKKKKMLMRKSPNKDNDPRRYKEWEKQMEEASEAFSELMIHQAVHTIEFVLSTVSHTASYLRLWALSLAHAQLSEMLWKMVFAQMALEDHSLAGGPKIVIIFAVWAFFTITILVLMEGLSAFLHTLRLHWVEFMSKFFKGAGYMFKPFSFNALFADAGREKMEVCPPLKTFDY